MHETVQFGIELKTPINIDCLKTQIQCLSFSDTVKVKIKDVNTLFKVG